MKQRLPLLTKGPGVERRAPVGAQRAMPSTRAAVDRALVCVSDRSDGVLAARFACGLSQALRGRGAEVAVLLAPEPQPPDRETLRRLQEVGARPLALLSASELPGAALRVMHELPQRVVVIAIGPSLAESLQGLLRVCVGRDPAAVERASRPVDAIDLHLGLELDGVASRIADWLAREVALE